MVPGVGGEDNDTMLSTLHIDTAEIEHCTIADTRVVVAMAKSC